MLKGIELGKAIEQARKLKGIKKAELARQFGVKPPSVSGWIATGRIDKHHLNGLFRYFSDVVPASHWGLDLSADGTLSIDSLLTGVSPQSRAAIEQLALAAATARLSETDLMLLAQVALRFEPAPGR